MITVNNDGTFDGGAQPVSTSATLQEVGRLQPRGRRTLVDIIVGPVTIAHLTVLQGAYPDDPNPQPVGVDAGLNSVALADLSYVIPTLVFPLAAGSVWQLHFQGDAPEIIFQAGGAGGANGTVQVKGSTIKPY